MPGRWRNKVDHHKKLFGGSGALQGMQRLATVGGCMGS